MEHTNRLLVAAAHVGYHVVAISCVNAFEAADQFFVGAFGHDFRRWPFVILAIVLFLVYAVGFVSAVLIGKRLLERRARSRRPLLKVLPLITSAETQGEARSAKPVLAAAMMLIVSAAALAGYKFRKGGDQK